MSKISKTPEHYFEHRDELDQRAAKAIRDGKRVAVPAFVEQMREQLRPITLRMQVADIARAKAQAERRGLPYQTYLKSLLHQALANAESAQR